MAKSEKMLKNREFVVEKDRMTRNIMEENKKGYGEATIKYIDPLLPFFKVIYYKKGKYRVIDRYSGDENFIGQTVYSLNQKPVYGLNYYGIVINKRFKTGDIYAFLKRALVAGSSRYRGFDGYKEEKWLYKNKYSEKRGFVEGEEKIYFNRKVVYMLVYHGGKVIEHKSLKEFLKNLYTWKKDKGVYNKRDKMNFRKIMLKSGAGIILGKDESSNDYLMNDFKGKTNIILHTVAPGSPFGVIDKIDPKPAKKEIYEAGIFVARHSHDWRDNKKDVKMSVFTGKDISKEKGMKPGLWSVNKSKVITIKKKDISRTQ